MRKRRVKSLRPGRDLGSRSYWGRESNPVVESDGLFIQEPVVTHAEPPFVNEDTADHVRAELQPMRPRPNATHPGLEIPTTKRKKRQVKKFVMIFHWDLAEWIDRSKAGNYLNKERRSIEKKCRLRSRRRGQ